jgi:hypothetical protein
VRKEWTFAVGYKKRIIPVFLDSTGLPPELETFQGINFRLVHGSHQSPAFEELQQSYVDDTVPSPAPFAVGLIVTAAIVGFAVVFQGTSSLWRAAAASFLVAVAAGIILVILTAFVLTFWPARPRSVPVKPRDNDIEQMAQLLRERLQKEAL